MRPWKFRGIPPQPAGGSVPLLQGCRNWPLPEAPHSPAWPRQPMLNDVIDHVPGPENFMTSPSFPSCRNCWAASALAVAVLTQAGCATTVDAQWSDPQLGPAALRGQRVLVACEADEPVVKRLCVDQLAAAVSARGATAVMAPAQLIDRPSGKNPPDEPYLEAARAQRATAVLTSRITPNATTARPGFSVGLGGFGFSNSGFGTGVGISAPIGGGDARTQYAANTRVIDPNGKLLWTAKATASPRTTDLQSQVSELTRSVFDAIDKSGLF